MSSLEIDEHSDSARVACVTILPLFVVFVKGILKSSLERIRQRKERKKTKKNVLSHQRNKETKKKVE